MHNLIKCRCRSKYPPKNTLRVQKMPSHKIHDIIHFAPSPIPIFLFIAIILSLFFTACGIADSQQRCFFNGLADFRLPRNPQARIILITVIITVTVFFFPILPIEQYLQMARMGVHCYSTGQSGIKGIWGSK